MPRAQDAQERRAQAPQVYDYLAGTHRLGSVDGVERDYDDNGNLVSINTGRAHPEYQYDDRNRMSTSLFNGATLASYILNGRGERVGKTVPGPTPVTHQFVYDEAGHLLGQYVVGVKLKQGTETLYLDGTPVATTVAGSLSYLETDHLGTPRIAANPTTNAQQWKWDFFANAFGDNGATIAASGGIDVKLRYPGQVFDAETGLHYNYFRDHEPGTGRYVESDPIGLDGGIADYVYIGASNPLAAVDPYGLFDMAWMDCKVREMQAGMSLNCGQSKIRRDLPTSIRKLGDALETPPCKRRKPDGSYVLEIAGVTGGYSALGTGIAGARYGLQIAAAEEGIVGALGAAEAVYAGGLAGGTLGFIPGFLVGGGLGLGYYY